MNRNSFLRIGLLIVALGAFAVYFIYNHEQFAVISSLQIWQVAAIVFGQSLIILSNIIILQQLVRFIAKRVSFIDASRVTAYSSIINFFGFLQAGLGFRALYLKKYFKMSIKRYTYLTFIQYMGFFGFSGLIILVGLISSNKENLRDTFWLLIIAALLAGLLYFAIPHRKAINYLKQRFSVTLTVVRLAPRPFFILLAACVLQLIGSAIAYSVELAAAGAHITIEGLLIYTGVAQFSIVIAVTPGAIGIREGLLLVVQQQMDLTTNNILVASAIDRLVYFITLLIFTPLAFGAKKRLALNNNIKDHAQLDR